MPTASTPDDVPTIEFHRVHRGDCLDILAGWPGGCIDLAYIDPPFASARSYSASGRGTGEPHSFDDRFDSVGDYIAYMEMRVLAIHRVLRPTGTFWYHCDWHAGHYVKVMLDGVFGYGNFLNEIIWHYGLGGSSQRFYPRKHDTLFWYARDVNEPYHFKAPLVPASSQRMKGQMKKQDDVWDIPAINNMAKERLGYPTQKPMALLERIITSASVEGDVVLDAFCGSGTTLAAAKKHGRKWVGIDVNESSCELCRDRLGL